MYRVAPEQVRFATSEEHTLLGTHQAELLGIKDLIEGGAFKSQQYVDLVPQSYPPVADSDSSVEHPPVEDVESSHPPVVSDAQPSVLPPPLIDSGSSPSVPETPGPGSQDNPDAPMTESAPAVDEPAESSENVVNPEVATKESASTSVSSPSYGPVRTRRRVTGKDGPDSYWRPAAMHQDDFVEIMREVVPQLIAEMPSQPDSSTGSGQKRPAETTAADPGTEPPTSRARTLDSEVLAIQNMTTENLDMEILMAEYIKKKMSKEIPHSNNAPRLQKMVDEGKRKEWNTILSRSNVVKIPYTARKPSRSETPRVTVSSAADLCPPAKPPKRGLCQIPTT